MRVLIVDTYYVPFLEDHYARCPGLDALPYEEQRRSLLASSFGTSDAYSHYLRQLGHDAEEVIANCVPLQTAWAAERGFRTGKLHERARRLAPLEAILVEQVEAWQPDVVYVQDMWLPGPSVLRRLRRGGRLLAGQIAHELPHRDQVTLYDVVYTSFPHYVPRLRDLGVGAEYLRLAFDPRVLDRLGDVSLGACDVVFVGSLGAGQHATGNRLLEAAAEELPISFWGVGADTWPESSLLVRRHHGAAWGLDMYRVLASSRVALNRHIDVAAGHANNMRLYEATGVGTLLLTDRASNLADLFAPGSEVVVYDDVDDLVAKARALLADEPRRIEIARAGQERTMREHTWQVRMAELAELLTARLEARG